MDSIFNDLIGGSIIIVYMDNMFIFESELPPLIENTKTILQCLQDNNLYLKPSKCKFHKTKIEYIGLVIEEGKISMDTVMVCAWSHSFQRTIIGWLQLLGDAPRPPMFPPIFLRHLCIFLLIVASPRRSALAAPIPESDDHVT